MMMIDDDDDDDDFGVRERSVFIHRPLKLKIAAAGGCKLHVYTPDAQ